jgi:glucokinase
MSGAEKVVLAGDVGGTKTLLGLYAARGDRLAPVREARFLNDGYDGIEDVVHAFLGEGGPWRVASACLGVAGPVEDDRCEMTNIPWTIDGKALGQRFGIERVHLMNDMVAIGWGIALLSPDDIFVLQEGAPARGNAALMAAGTGLGEAVLFWDGSAHVPYASEGGHADFAPRSSVEAGLLERLSGLYGHVSYERVISGPGLENIYRYLRERSGEEEPRYLSRRFAGAGAAAAVTDEAIDGTDPVCRDSLSLFASIYGAEAGNLALKCMAIAGVYIAGGMAPRVFDLPVTGGGASEGNTACQASEANRGGSNPGPGSSRQGGDKGRLTTVRAFIGSFRDKGRLEGLLSRVPVYVILNERAGLFGAARHAAGMLSGKGARKAVLRIERG